MHGDFASDVVSSIEDPVSRVLYDNSSKLHFCPRYIPFIKIPYLLFRSPVSSTMLVRSGIFMEPNVFIVISLGTFKYFRRLHALSDAYFANLNFMPQSGPEDQER